MHLIFFFFVLIVAILLIGKLANLVFKFLQSTMFMVRFVACIGSIAACLGSRALGDEIVYEDELQKE